MLRPPRDQCKEGGDGADVDNAAGTFLVSGPADAPSNFGVGTYTDANGTLNVLTCVPSDASARHDRLTFDLQLVLDGVDDRAVDLPIGGHVTGTDPPGQSMSIAIDPTW